MRTNSPNHVGDFDIGLWLESRGKSNPASSTVILDAIQAHMGDAPYTDFDVQKLALPPSVKDPLRILRNRIVPASEGSSEDRFAHYPSRGLLVGRTKDNPEVQESPVRYYAARVSRAPEGTPSLPKYTSRASVHELTGRFIVEVTLSGNADPFTTHDLAVHLGLPSDYNGLRRAGQEINYFTRQMSDCPAPEGWVGWAFLLGGKIYRLQQTRCASMARLSRSEERDESRQGRAVPSSWLVIDITGKEIRIDTRANTTF